MIDVIARGMIEESNGDISQISEKVNNHTEDSDIHVTTTDKENWNSHPNDVQAEGNPVQIDGLQEGVPFSEIVVSGKNLIPFPYYDGMSKTHNGITFAVNSDGSVTANGTATDIAYFYIAMYAKIIENGVTYAISGSPEGSNVDTYRIFINERKSDGTSNGVFIADFNDNKSFTVTDNCDSINIAIQIRSGVTVDNVVFRPQLEIGTTVTPYEPPITGRDLTVNVCGKNLLTYPYNETTKTVNGITFTDNGDGTITANGTATANTTFFLSSKIVYKSGVDYIISGCPNGGDRKFKIKGNSDGVNADDVGYGKTFSFSEDTECSVSILIYKDVTVENLVFRPQIELGGTATDYEPYHGSTITITPDSNPYTIPNDICQLDGLNNISVSAGELSVTGVRKNAAVKKIWDKIDELTTAIIVSNGETIE